MLPSTAAQFGRAIVMPNLSPPITTVAAAQAYRDRLAELAELAELLVEKETVDAVELQELLINRDVTVASYV